MTERKAKTGLRTLFVGRREGIARSDVWRRSVNEREGAELEPIAAWLEPREDDDDDEPPGAALL